MPGRDRTGPMGYGPETGWGAGFCGGTPYPDIPGRGYGMGYRRGRGFRGGMGRGRGAGWSGPFAQPNPDEERCFLKDEMEVLQKRLDFVKKRIEEISAQENKRS